MVQLSNVDAEIAVIGRCEFASGIGAMSYAACELIARAFPVCVIPTEPHLREAPFVTLPNGRTLPVCHDTKRIRASFFCDVPWNGSHDYNFSLAPANSLKYVWLVYDSDVLPPRWTELFNHYFDLVVATSPHLIGVARNSGVTNPIACVPIPLDLEPLLAEPVLPRSADKVRFGSVAAFHPRKGIVTLVEAFQQAFGGQADVELVLHSNLKFGDTLEAAQRLAAGASNIQFSHDNLDVTDKNRLIRSFDVFVNASRGEGYSIGPREALAQGKALVLSNVGGHQDLAGRPGVFLAEPTLTLPARYPEIDNDVFGRQRAVTATSMAASLTEALGYVKSPRYEREAYARRAGARDFSFGALATSFSALFDPTIPLFRTEQPPPDVCLPADFKAKVQSRLGNRACALQTTRRQVCAAYDAGFFSIFNTFMTHLVWQQREERCHAVYPDWDVDRLVDRLGDDTVMSFCYGQPGDGNLWLQLFEPLFGSTDEEMNDPAFLYQHAEEPAIRHNENREPLMTHVNAYRLYKTHDFTAWRRLYHRIFSRHVRLRPDRLAETEAFAARHLNRRFVVGAHIRHPSHTVEQPDALIANEDAYIARIYDVVRARGLELDGPDWGVFLATDQNRVVARLRSEFGDRLACYDDVRRTLATEDEAFAALPDDEKNREGHQLQHLVAANRVNWSVRMAWEVVRDAYAMARCHALLHVVSNVSTAVAYMNPEVDMVFCES